MQQWLSGLCLFLDIEGNESSALNVFMPESIKFCKLGREVSIVMLQCWRGASV